MNAVVKVIAASWFLTTTVASAGPFVEHLNEAISLNSARKPKYAELTQNRSLKISNALINLERLSLFSAYALEMRLASYRRAGIEFFENALVSMDGVPEFVEIVPGRVPLAEEFNEVKLPEIKRRLQKPVSELDFVEIVSETKLLLRGLAEPAQFHCMLRHVLESLVRGAQAGAYAMEQAEQKHLSTKELRTVVKAYLNSHLIIVSSAHQLDQSAVGIQAEGVPILCNDVPPIPDFTPLD